MAKKSTAEAVREIAVPVAEALGLSVWDVTFKKEGPEWYLTIFIDRAGGVAIDDCEAVSRAIDPLIDELDPTDHPYCLVVSSPGLGRALRSDAHLLCYVGKRVAVRLIRPDANGARDLAGVLTGFDGETVTIDGETVIERKDTAAIKAADDEDVEELLR